MDTVKRRACITKLSLCLTKVDDGRTLVAPPVRRASPVLIQNRAQLLQGASLCPELLAANGGPLSSDEPAGISQEERGKTAHFGE